MFGRNISQSHILANINICFYFRVIVYRILISIFILFAQTISYKFRKRIKKLSVKFYDKVN